MTPARKITYGFILGVIGFGGPIVLAMPPARAATATRLSHFVSSCQHRIAIARDAA
jgi:hypothetical protein